MLIKHRKFNCLHNPSIVSRSSFPPLAFTNVVSCGPIVDSDSFLASSLPVNFFSFCITYHNLITFLCIYENFEDVEIQRYVNLKGEYFYFANFLSYLVYLVDKIID